MKTFWSRVKKFDLANQLYLNFPLVLTPEWPISEFNRMYFLLSGLTAQVSVSTCVHLFWMQMFGYIQTAFHQFSANMHPIKRRPQVCAQILLR